VSSKGRVVKDEKIKSAGREEEAVASVAATAATAAARFD
jgi:hypothetical protein